MRTSHCRPEKLSSVKRSNEGLEQVQGSPILNPARSNESAIIWKEVKPFLGAAEIKDSLSSEFEMKRNFRGPHV